VVVVAAAHVFVCGAGARRLVGRGQRLLIEVVLKNRQHVSIAASAGKESAPAGGFDARIAVLLRESEQSQARAIAPLRVSAVAQNRFAECACAWAERLGPTQDAGRSPFCVSTVRARHVLGLGGAPAADEAAHVAGGTSAEVKNLDRACGRADPQLLAQQRMRRRVEVVIELDVVVDVEPDFFQIEA
jgi:hypothetical protein